MKKIIFLIPMLFLAFIISCDSDSDSGAVGGGADATGNENIAPIFLSAAPVIAQVDMEYRYDAIIIDPDGEAKALVFKINPDDTCAGVVVFNRFAHGNTQDERFAPLFELVKLVFSEAEEQMKMEDI